MALEVNLIEFGPECNLQCLFFMPRAKRILQADYPYHVTLRSINKMTFEMPLGDLWDFTCDLLLFCSYAFKIEVHAFVLMNNHFHLILRTPNADLDKFMAYFNTKLSQEIGFRTSRINQKFGGRYRATVISDLSYFHNAYKYVYRNPIAAKVCNAVEDYKFSSINFVLGRDSYRFPVFDTYFQDIEDHWPTLSWLNTSFKEEEAKLIKSGLKKSHFSILS